MVSSLEPIERKVMAALVARGHYPETPDAFEWAQVDARRIVQAWRESNGGPTVVAMAMTDTGLHPRGHMTEAEIACFHADQYAVWDVFDAEDGGG